MSSSWVWSAPWGKCVLMSLGCGNRWQVLGCKLWADCYKKTCHFPKMLLRNLEDLGEIKLNLGSVILRPVYHALISLPLISLWHRAPRRPSGHKHGIARAKIQSAHCGQATRPFRKLFKTEWSADVFSSVNRASSSCQPFIVFRLCCELPLSVCGLH